MLKQISILLLTSFSLFACNQSAQIEQETKNAEEANKISEIEMTKEEKDIADEQFFESLEKLQIYEKDFLYISKYIIELAKKNNFSEVDPILGIKEFMSTKDFTYPYAFYHYSDIPTYPELEIVLKIEKNNNKLKSIYFTPGVPINFILRNSNINILDELKLKLEKKELFYYSNQLARYQLSDGTFKYEVVARNTHMENTLPKDFYSFKINIE